MTEHGYQCSIGAEDILMKSLQTTAMTEPGYMDKETHKV